MPNKKKDTPKIDPKRAQRFVWTDGQFTIEKGPKPKNPLFDILRPAYKPCPNFKTACKGYCQWIRRKGHVPRAFGGATGAISDIRLILVTAEPGDPADGEVYSGSPDKMLHHSMSVFTMFLRENNLRRNGKPALFHENMRTILKLCWPGDSLEDQLRKTWVTPSVLCSALASGNPIPSLIENTCVSTYLAPQINLLENAFVLALGGKARQRLKRNGVRVDSHAHHPSARPVDQPETSWRKSAKAFRSWLECHPSTLAAHAASSDDRRAQAQAIRSTQRPFGENPLSTHSPRDQRSGTSKLKARQHSSPTTYDPKHKVMRHVDGIPVKLALQKRTNETRGESHWTLSWRTRYSPGGRNRRFYQTQNGFWTISVAVALEMIQEMNAWGGLDEKYFDPRPFELKALVSTEMTLGESAEELARLTGPDEDWGSDPFFVIISDPNDKWKKIMIVDSDTDTATFRSITEDPDYKPKTALRPGDGWWLDNSMMDANVQQTRAFYSNLRDYLVRQLRSQEAND
jgi:hypothetical protein